MQTMDVFKARGWISLHACKIKDEEAEKVKERARERVPHGGLHVNENGGTYTTSFTLKYHCIAYLNLRITTRPYSFSFFITLN